MTRDCEHNISDEGWLGRLRWSDGGWGQLWPTFPDNRFSVEVNKNHDQKTNVHEHIVCFYALNIYLL